MAYITREDGEHFVIPSYREVLTGKSKATLRKEITLLSKSYGDLITLQRKDKEYEVAFSTDPGYLLGESIWEYFKKPNDLIYCEAIPDSQEAILVVVTNGNVYLDGSFGTAGIPEELIPFLSQKQHFEIYIYGDVPISRTASDGKFSFEASSVKSFTELDTPIFPKVPLLKQYKMQPVEVVLKERGIGVVGELSLKPILIIAVLIGLCFGIYYFSSDLFKKEKAKEKAPDPFAGYYAAMNSPSPDQELHSFVNEMLIFLNIPGWTTRSISYTRGMIVANIYTTGGLINSLIDWGRERGIDVTLLGNNVILNKRVKGLKLRDKMYPNDRDDPAIKGTAVIYPIRDVMARVVDNVEKVYPSKKVSLSSARGGAYQDVTANIRIDRLSPVQLAILSNEFKSNQVQTDPMKRYLPVVLKNINLTVTSGSLSGTINLQLLGI